MSRLEPAETIEATVGVPRHPTEHFARAVSSEERVYLLHSAACRDSGVDLRSCEYSVAMDRGITTGTSSWNGWHLVQDRPVRVDVVGGVLVPDPDAVEVILLARRVSEAVHGADIRLELPYANEYDLQAGIARALTAAGIDADQEVRLGPRSRIDFFIPLPSEPHHSPGIGIEVKVKYPGAGVTQQLIRYAEHPAIAHLMLITTRPALHAYMPPVVSATHHTSDLGIRLERKQAKHVPLTVVYLTGAAL